MLGHDSKKPNFMTVPAASRELDKLEMIRQTDGRYRLDHAVTATQKTILKAVENSERTYEEIIAFLSGDK